MRPYPQVLIQVQGFADSTGPDALNQNLSEERARAVARYLASEGIDNSRIVVQGFASGFAAGSNETAQGRRNNRRVEVTVR
jgi:OOP family OmpA-OmpF porin